MSWGLGWKRPSVIFRLSLDYGDGSGEQVGGSDPGFSSPPAPPAPLPPLPHPPPPPPPPPPRTLSFSRESGFRIDLEWSAGDDEDQVALRLQSQLMVALPPPRDSVVLSLAGEGEEEDCRVRVDMKVTKRREPLRSVTMSKAVGSGQISEGIGILPRLIASSSMPSGPGESLVGFDEHWKSLTTLSLCECGLSVLPVELTRFPHLERLYLDNNKLSSLPPEIGQMTSLKVLRVDHNLLVSVPVELRQCIDLVELSLEHNKLIRPLLDFRAMAGLRVLRLFSNPLEFLPEILPLQSLRHLSLANIRIEATDNLKSVNVRIETENNSYFVASRHKLSAFCSLIFRFSSCHHPLLASALAKILEDHGNRLAISKEENAVKQLISMISSDNRHVVEQACSALSSLAADVSLAMQLIKSDIMQPIESILKSFAEEEVISVLQVVVTMAFASDTVAQKMLSKDVLKSLKALCGHKTVEVQKMALLAVGNLAFCLENRRILSASESLRELLLRLMVVPEPRVNKTAARALAILGENENLRRAIRGRSVGKHGLRILSMDGGGMKGLATVQILRQIELGTGKSIHESFDLICGTSTGGMLAIALGIKRMTLDRCEEIYKTLGKVVFTEPVPKDNEAATWREKLDQLYKSSSQSFRVVVHGSKHSADNFERLLKEICADEDGDDLLIESAVKGVPKVFVVSTLVSAMPAQPFLFRNYQYPVGTPEVPHGLYEIGTAGSAVTGGTGSRRSAFFGSCKHRIWEAIRASSAAPYYLDDFSDDVSRWQDGAIVANNPTIFAIREAQLLWPDTPINCIVSIGCGSVPAKARKGGWRYLDTGQVLIESACSVDRVEEALDTLLPMIPDVHYFRFNPVDERCGMELDETDPAIWLKLEAATEEYIQSHAQAFKSAYDCLLPRYQADERPSEKLRSQHFSRSKPSNAGRDDDGGPSLGWRRMVLLVESPGGPDSGGTARHAQSLETFCARNAVRLSVWNRSPWLSKTPPAAASLSTPFQSPLLTGSFPSSPLLYSPDLGSQRIGRVDSVPPLSLDGGPGPSSSLSPPGSPVSWEPSPLVRALHEKLHSLPQVGIIHLALHNDPAGSILSWQNDVLVVADPGEMAERFLESAKQSLCSALRSRSRRRGGGYAWRELATVGDLVARHRSFLVGGILHRYMGRQTQVMEDDQEVSAYMFRRTVPATHLSSEDVRWMVGAWRDRIVICTGKHGPPAALVKALLDSGAKAVVSPSSEPPPISHPSAAAVPGEDPATVAASENGKFVIGDDDDDDDDGDDSGGGGGDGDDGDDSPPASPISDWEDSEEEDAARRPPEEEEEEELSKFVCLLYETLYRDGARIDVALQHALRSHPKLRYSCHLPSIIL